jgi:cation:H+ antiporter
VELLPFRFNSINFTGTKSFGELMWLSLLIIATSFILLYLGSKFLLNGIYGVSHGNNLALSFRNLLKISFVLSTPAFSIGLCTTAYGSGNIIIGSILGSNLFNLCCILGVSAFIIPVRTKLRLNRYQILMLIASMIVFIIMFNDRVISKIEGGILILTFSIYAILNICLRRKDLIEASEELQNEVNLMKRNWFHNSLNIIAGITALISGSWLLAAKISGLSGNLGLGETTFGFIIVSIGISLPLMAFSINAAFNKNTDLVLGVVVFSSILNILGVVGVSALFKSLEAMAISNIDLYGSLCIILIQIQFLHNKYKLRRDEAIFLIIIFGMYIYYLLPR